MSLVASICRSAERILAVETQPFLLAPWFLDDVKSTPDKNGHPSHGHTPQYWSSLFAAAAAGLVAQGNNRDTAFCNRSLTNISNSNSKGGKRSRFDADSFLDDCNDENDRAFDLVVNYKFGINNAITYTKAPITYQGLYQRVKRHQASKELKEAEEGAAHCLANWCSSKSHTGEGGHQQQ